MRLKAKLQNRIVRTILDPARQKKQREKAEQNRQSEGRPHVVEYFHDASDPYSHLMAKMLPEFFRRYDIGLNVNIVPPAPDWAAPDRERLEDYSRRDAVRLAKKIGLHFEDPGHQPSAAHIAEANAALIAATDKNKFLFEAAQIGERLWKANTPTIAAKPSASVEERLQAGAKKRQELGHYLGATLYYEGEWYWGPDRLHYLEARLRELGVTRDDAPYGFLFRVPNVPKENVPLVSEARPELNWYLSFRSPYTAIVADRVKALADAYNADLRLRFVLPMVMRGMKVPRMKGFYIMKDTAREAARQNIPYGNIFDPVGKPVERAYALLPSAMEQGIGFEYVRSFLSGVWAEGLDAGTDRDLKTIAERAGLDWGDVKGLIGKDHWRDEAEANRQEMFDWGLWGVPSFRVGEIATWGQDRLWIIEDALK